MAAQLGTSEFKVEEWSAGGGPTRDIHYYKDPISGDWLSLHETTIILGANTANYLGFLRGINGVPGGSNHGYEIPHDFRLRYPVGSEEIASGGSNVSVNIYNNNSLIWGPHAWNPSAVHTLDVDGDAGCISVSMGFVGAPYVFPDRPTVVIGLRWRL